MKKEVTHSSEKRSHQKPHQAKHHNRSREILDQPKYQLHSERQDGVQEEHAAFAVAVRGLDEDETAETEAAVET